MEIENTSLMGGIVSKPSMVIPNERVEFVKNNTGGQVYAKSPSGVCANGMVDEGSGCRDTYETSEKKLHKCPPGWREYLNTCIKDATSTVMNRFY